MESIALFDPERSDDSEKIYALADPAVTLPPYFRVNWGPITSLLATEQGKTLNLLGVQLEPLQIIG